MILRWIRGRLAPATGLLSAARKELVRMDEEYAAAIDRAEKAEARERLLLARLKLAETRLFRIGQLANGPARLYADFRRLLLQELSRKENG